MNVCRERVCSRVGACSLAAARRTWTLSGHASSREVAVPHTLAVTSSTFAARARVLFTSEAWT